MAEVQYTDIPDTQKQHIKESADSVREYQTPTLNSFKNERSVTGGLQGYQIAFFTSDYAQNSYLAPGASSNSYQQPIAPTTQSMWVGLSYQAKVMYSDGFLAQ